jgi:hypothetical protein
MYNSLKQYRFSKIEIEQILKGEPTGFVKNTVVDFQSLLDKDEKLYDDERVKLRKLLLDNKLPEAKRYMRELLENKR